MTDAITIPLPWLRPPLRANDRRSWQAQHRARAEVLDAARYAVRAARITPIVGANVALHWRPANNRRQDADGMFPTLKVSVDAVVLEGVLPDDCWVNVPAMTCRIHEPDGEPRIWLELTPPPEGFKTWETP